MSLKINMLEALRSIDPALVDRCKSQLAHPDAPLTPKRALTFIKRLRDCRPVIRQMLWLCRHTTQEKLAEDLSVDLEHEIAPATISRWVNLKQFPDHKHQEQIRRQYQMRRGGVVIDFSSSIASPILDTARELYLNGQEDRAMFIARITLHSAMRSSRSSLEADLGESTAAEMHDPEIRAELGLLLANIYLRRKNLGEAARYLLAIDKQRLRRDLMIRIEQTSIGVDFEAAKLSQLEPQLKSLIQRSEVLLKEANRAGKEGTYLAKLCRNTLRIPCCLNDLDGMHEWFDKHQRYDKWSPGKWQRQTTLLDPDEDYKALNEAGFYKAFLKKK